MDDFHQTPPVLWIAVALMCVGFALIGGAVIALGGDTAIAPVLFALGGLLGVVGIVLAARNHIMRNVA
jgi:peptidoglycan/LPS O-acetylase OafA/YrhL